MNISFALSTFFEFIMVVAVVWCIFNESKLIAFEKRIASLIRRRRLKVVKPAAGYYVQGCSK
ncbi:MAG: hypothetical protein IKD04_06365 [Clostridia bacterium]|nr:hypothetical protein [Clostridia bacterium]